MSINQRASPIVAIFTTCFRGRYLIDCVNSVLNQTSKNWEWHIFIANPSRRAAKEIESILAKYKGIRAIYVHKQKSRRVDIAFKKMLCLTHSSYVVKLDDDDLLMPNAIKEVSRHASINPNAPLIRAGTANFNDSNLSQIQRMASESSFYPPINDSILFNFNQAMGGLFAANARFLRRIEPIKVYQKFDWIGGDIDLMLKLEELGKPEWIPKYLYLYRRHSLSWTDRATREIGIHKIVEFYLRSAIRRRGLKLSATVSPLDPALRHFDIRLKSIDTKPHRGKY